MALALPLVCGSRLWAQAPRVCTGPAGLEKIIAIRPSSGAYNALGAYFGQRRQLACAIKSFQSAIHLDQNSWESRFNLSLAYLANKQPEKAASELKMAIAKNPDDPREHTALGIALSELNQNDAAIEEFKVALKADPRSVPALDGIAKALIAQQRYSAAIGYLKDAPADPILQDDLAVAYSRNGNAAMAVQLLSGLVKRYPKSAQHRNDLGVAYAQLAQYRQAGDEFREALRLNPTDQAIRLSYVRNLALLAEFGTALPEIQTYMRHAPHDFEGLSLLGAVDRGLGKYAEAESALRQALALDANDYDVRYNLGFVLAKLGKPREALVQLQKALDLNPASTEARFQLAAVLRGLGQEQEARDQLAVFQQTKQQSVQENVAGTKVNEANEFLRAREYQRAADLYRESLAEDPGNARTWYNLSLALDALGKVEEEREALEKAVSLDASIAAPHNQLGVLNLEAGRLPDAEKELKTAIALDPSDAEAQTNLGTLYRQQGKNQEAEKLFRQAVENDRQYAPAFINLGLTLASESRFPEAEPPLRRALEIQENNAEALTALAMVLTRMNRSDEGTVLFRKVLALDPKSSSAHLNLGIALADLYDLEGAVAEFSEAARLNPDSAPAHCNKGRALLDLRRDGEAKPELEIAARIDPQYPEAWYLLGLIEKGAGNSAAAVQMLEKAAALDPHNTDTLFVLGQELLDVGDKERAIAQWQKVVQIEPENGQALYNLARALASSDPKQSKQLQARFEGLQERSELTDSAQRLGNFALSSAAAHDWPQAIAQLKEGIQACGNCELLGKLRKDLGLIYLHSGDMKQGLTELLEAKKLKPNDLDIDKAIEIAQAGAPR